MTTPKKAAAKKPAVPEWRKKLREDQYAMNLKVIKNLKKVATELQAIPIEHIELVMDAIFRFCPGIRVNVYAMQANGKKKGFAEAQFNALRNIGHSLRAYDVPGGTARRKRELKTIDAFLERYKTAIDDKRMIGGRPLLSDKVLYLLLPKYRDVLPAMDGMFHKNFRAFDITNNGAIDMVIYHALDTAPIFWQIFEEMFTPKPATKKAAIKKVTRSDREPRA